MKKSKVLEERIRRVTVLFKELGYEIATPDEARDMLHLKGANKVKL